MSRPRTEWPDIEVAVEAAVAQGAMASRVTRLWPRLRPGGFPPGVYVLTYHSVVEPGREEPWEAAYRVVRTPVRTFRDHLRMLTRKMCPVALPDVPRLLADGPVKEPCFAVTFDDGFANLAGAAAAVCDEFGVHPTVFACADFAAGRSVSYRVLLAVLEATGQGAPAARELNRRLGRSDLVPGSLLAGTKDHYRAVETEEAALEAWRACHPGDKPPQAHLSFAQLRELVDAGWSVGNHTLGHRTLAALEPAELERQVIGNAEELEAAGLSPIPWLAYPQGAARHVSPLVRELLDRLPQTMGVFCAGGVNLVRSRTQWLRIPVLGQSAGRLSAMLGREARATRRALGERAGSRAEQ
jgi:peptidoglycan/xylan/chitin deacetylase (PgdA/CDA1 family)